MYGQTEGKARVIGGKREENKRKKRKRLKSTSLDLSWTETARFLRRADGRVGGFNTTLIHKYLILVTITNTIATTLSTHHYFFGGSGMFDRRLFLTFPFK